MALLALLACLVQAPARAQTTLHYWDFENFTPTNWRGWTADNGVWDVGNTVRGPGGPHQGSQCASSGLTTNYPTWRDSRLISPAVTLPSVAAGQSLQLGFWQWFSFAGNGGLGDDWGYGNVVARAWNGTSWGAWAAVTRQVANSGGGWSYSGADLTHFAGQRIQFAFEHVGRQYEGAGWFIDEVRIAMVADMAWDQPVSFEDFTADTWHGWSADCGVWQVGTTSRGSGAAHDGMHCASSGLTSNYPTWRDSRLISPAVTLPSVAAGQSLQLGFWQWFSFADNGGLGDDWGYGNVVARAWNGTSWGAWAAVTRQVANSGGGWSYSGADLTHFAGQRIQFAFEHVGRQYEGAGWFIDCIRAYVLRDTDLNQSMTFEAAAGGDWQGWSADHGIWQVGTPTNGPSSAHEGSQCAATGLRAGYPTWSDSRLVTPAIALPVLADPSSSIGAVFWQWFSFADNGGLGDDHGYGRVEVSTWDPAATKWGGWTPASSSSYTGTSSGWKFVGSNFPVVDLSAYSGKRVRLGFHHVGRQLSAPGWFVDEVTVFGPPTLTSVAPNSAPAGSSAAVTITLTGSGFTADSEVRWNGAPLATTYVSPTQMTAVVPAGNLATAGTYAITVMCPIMGEQTSNAVSFTVTEPNTLIEVPDASGVTGMPVDLRATLTRTSDGAGLAARTVTFQIDGTVVGSVDTDADGLATYPWTITEGPASRTIGASFAGDADYDATSGTGALAVNAAPSSLYVPDRTGTVTSSVTLRGHLRRTSDDDPISGRLIGFRIDGTSVGSATTGTGGSPGRAELNWVIPEGTLTRTIAGEFAGDEAYLPSGGTGTLTVTPAPTVTTTIDRTGVVGEVAILRGYLRRTTDYAWLDGRTVTFRIEGTVVGSATTGATGASGRADLTWTITPGSASRTIAAEFAGDGLYNASSGTSTLTSQVWATKMATFDRSARITATTELKARLVRSDNVPLYNLGVDFYVDGTFVITRLTDTQGYARYAYYHVPDGAGAGTRTILSSWAGNGGYLAVSKTATLTVLKATPYIWVMPRSVPQGGVVRMYAYFRRLADYEKQAGKTVTFRIDGTWIADVATGIGADAGIARYQYTSVEAPGTHTMRCEFAGDAWVDAGYGEANLTVY